MNLLKLFQFIALVSIFGSLLKAVPISYSGKVSINGINFDGEANFIFEILNPNETVLWKNGNTSEDSIKVTVRNGRYLVLLGGQGMNQLPPQLFLDNDEVYLKVSVDLKNGQGFQVLGPNQRITSNGYAKVAELSKYALKAGTADSAGSANSVATNVIKAEHLNENLLKYFKPTILIDPNSTEVFENGSTSFSVNADGKFLTYQWLKNGVELPGETNSSLSIQNIGNDFNDANITVRVSNDFGSVISKPANLKLNSVSNSWEKIWLDSMPLQYNAAFEDSKGDIVLHLIDTLNGNIEFLKLDPNGNTIFSKDINSSNYNMAAFTECEDGYFRVRAIEGNETFQRSQNSRGNIDYFLEKLDYNGNRIWDKTFGAEGDDLASGIIKGPNNSYLVYGTSDSNNTSVGEKSENSIGGNDIWLVLVDESGNKIWDKTIGSDIEDNPFFADSNDEGYFLTGKVGNEVGLFYINASNLQTAYLPFDTYSEEQNDFAQQGSFCITNSGEVLGLVQPDLNNTRILAIQPTGVTPVHNLPIGDNNRSILQHMIIPAPKKNEVVIARLLGDQNNQPVEIEILRIGSSINLISAHTLQLQEHDNQVTYPYLAAVLVDFNFLRNGSIMLGYYSLSNNDNDHTYKLLKLNENGILDVSASP
ncbi:immunoglobulin domain-containing protein [Opitutales bacterium]|nr:immunoglobulin domain-containing protein [Opitutales bacterium]